MAAGRAGRSCKFGSDDIETLSDDSSKAIPEIITIIPVIENKFDLDAAEVAKKSTKMFAPRIGAI